MKGASIHFQPFNSSRLVKVLHDVDDPFTIYVDYRFIFENVLFFFILYVLVDSRVEV